MWLLAYTLLKIQTSLYIELGIILFHLQAHFEYFYHNSKFLTTLIALTK